MPTSSHQNHRPSPKHADALRNARRAATRNRADEDGLVRQTFTLPRQDARAAALEWFERWPKAAYWSRVEHWRKCPDDTIEFTMVRLPSAD